MTAPTCANCRFWKPNLPPIGLGTCRRYAPRPAHQWSAFHAEAVIAIADILSRRHGIEWPDALDAGQATETTHSAEWPHTYDEEWCGEWEIRP